MEDLATARKAAVTKEGITIVDGAGSEDAIRERINQKLSFFVYKYHDL